jgi:hypothetical protein
LINEDVISVTIVGFAQGRQDAMKKIVVCGFRMCIFAILLSVIQIASIGCYSYRVLRFDPRDIPIDGGKLVFSSQESYYDSLLKVWRTYAGDKKYDADVRWDIFFKYEVMKAERGVYQLDIDRIFVIFDNERDSMAVAISSNKLNDFDPGFGIAVFGPIRFDEKKYPKINVRGLVKVRDSGSGKLIKSISIDLKGKLSKGHGSYFME